MKKFLVAVCASLLMLSALAVSSVRSAKTDTSQEQVPFPEVQRITKEELKALLGKPGLILLDVRIEEEWKTSLQKLPGAVHEDPLELDTWAPKYPRDATIVLY